METEVLDYGNLITTQKWSTINQTISFSARVRCNNTHETVELNTKHPPDNHVAT